MTLNGLHGDDDSERAVLSCLWYLNRTIANIIDSTIIVMAQARAATGWDANEHDIPRPESALKGTFGNLKFSVTVRSIATANRQINPRCSRIE